MDEVRLAPFALSYTEVLAMTRKLRSRFLLAWDLLGSMLIGFLIAFASGVQVTALAWIPIFVILFSIHMAIILPRNVKRAHSITFADREMTMTATHLSWKIGDDLESRVSWKVITKASFFKAIHLLALPGGNMVAIPRRVLTNDQEHFLVDRLREHRLLP